MGQCMELKDTSTTTHPLLGPLQEVRKDNQTYLLLNFAIINEEEYISLSKDIHKLKYNLQLKDHLYLPITQHFTKSSLFCETISRFELLLPIYHKHLQQIFQENTSMNNRFSQLEIWYLLLLTTKYLRHFNKKGRITQLEPSHFVVFQDGSLKIIPEVIIPRQDMSSQVLQLSRYTSKLGSSLKKIGSESTTSGHLDHSVIYKLGLICLAAATQANYQELAHQTNVSFDRKERIQALLSSCQLNYSMQLIDILSLMVMEDRETQKNTIQMIYNKAGMYQNQIKAKLELGIPFGEFEGEALKQTNRMFELGTPKHSRIGPQSEYHKHSIDYKDKEDGIVQKPEQLASPVDNYLSIL